MRHHHIDNMKTLHMSRKLFLILHAFLIAIVRIDWILQIRGTFVWRGSPTIFCSVSLSRFDCTRRKRLDIPIRGVHWECYFGLVCLKAKTPNLRTTVDLLYSSKNNKEFQIL